MKATEMKPTALVEYLRRLNTQAKLEERDGDVIQARLLRAEASVVRTHLRLLSPDYRAWMTK